MLACQTCSADQAGSQVEVRPVATLDNDDSAGDNTSKAAWFVRMNRLLEGAETEWLEQTLVLVRDVLDRRRAFRVHVPASPSSATPPAAPSIGARISPRLNEVSGSVVQFAMADYWCREEERSVNLLVLRLGAREKPGSVRYTTEPGTALPGVQYMHTEGLLEFGPGETKKEVEVKLLSDDVWHATETFALRIFEPVNCLLGDLSKVRVKVIDDDCFPTNKYSHILRSPGLRGELPDNIGHGPGQVSHWAVLQEYFKLNLNDRVVRRGSIKCILADQMKNCLSVLQIYMEMILLDVVFLAHPPFWNRKSLDQTARLMCLVCIAVVITAPRVLEHYIDYQRVFWKVGGKSRQMIQANLLKKFLAYTSDSKSLVPDSFLTMASTKHSHSMVHDGYLQVFPILKNLGGIVWLAILQANLGWFGLLPIAIFPGFMIVFLWCRTETTNGSFLKSCISERDLVNHVSRTAANVRLLTDFSQRGDVVQRYEGIIGKFNYDFSCASAVMVNNEQFAHWLADILVGVFIVIGGWYIVTADSSLRFISDPPYKVGAFCATMKIYKSLGSSFATMFKAGLIMQSMFQSLEDVVMLMNLSVEDSKRRELSQLRLATGMDSWDIAMRQKPRDHATEVAAHFDARKITRAIDRLTIKAKNVVFAYDVDSAGYPSSGATRLSVDVEILPGSIVVVVGKAHSGKGTLLKLLAEHVLPITGEVFIPPHSRMLHVPSEALFLNRRNLLANMRLGVADSDEAGDLTRVRNIMRRIGLRDQVIKMLDQDEAQPWTERYSAKEKQLLNLSRAFVHNPEVLVVHAPLQLFGDVEGEALMRVFKEFVEKRGVELSESSFEKRHPRTILMSKARHSRVGKDVEYANKVLAIEGEEVRLMDPDEFQPTHPPAAVT